MLPGGRPRLGIDAEDIGGQTRLVLRRAQMAEGILVRSVNSGSAAEKAGAESRRRDHQLQWGKKVRSLGDLRQRAGSAE